MIVVLSHNEVKDFGLDNEASLREFTEIANAIRREIGKPQATFVTPEIYDKATRKHHEKAGPIQTRKIRRFHRER